MKMAEYTTLQADSEFRRRRARSRAVLIGVIAAFALPVIVAYAMHAIGWRPAGMRNYGELLSPPLDASAVSAVDANGNPLVWANQGGHFRLVLNAPAACVPACAELATHLDGLWRGLGSDAPRLEILVAGAPDAATEAVVARGVLKRVHLTGDASAMPAGEGPAPHLYLVDPRGYVVLRWPAGFELAGVRRDLTRIIR